MQKDTYQHLLDFIGLKIWGNSEKGHTNFSGLRICLMMPLGVLHTLYACF